MLNANRSNLLKRYSLFRDRSGFTLIELLVVIGIIALLSAIILAVVIYARKRSLYAMDASNLRQIGMAIGMYQQDYGMFPHGASGLFPYARNKQIFICPADPTLGQGGFGEIWPGNPPIPCSYRFDTLDLLVSNEYGHCTNCKEIYDDHPGDYPFIIDPVHWYEAQNGSSGTPYFLINWGATAPFFILHGDGRVSTWEVTVHSTAWDERTFIQRETGEKPIILFPDGG